MSSYGGSSTGGNMALFDKPKVHADPEAVKMSLSKCLADFGSTLGISLDLEAIEKAAADEERMVGETFMNKQMKLHELASFEREANSESDEDSQDLEFFGEEGGEGDENERPLTAARIAAISFAPEDKPPAGLQPSQQLSKEKMAAMKRRNSSRRRSSGLSSYDEVAYNMFGGDEHKFTTQYMTSKWKKEGKAMFEEANGIKKAKFRGDVVGGGGGDDDEGSTAVSVEPGEVPSHTRMRLYRIDGVQVVRHELNVDGLYGGLRSQMSRNVNVMLDVQRNSEVRLEERKHMMKRQHESLLARRTMLEKEKVEREVEEAKKREEKRANGSSLVGIGDLLNMDKNAFKDAANAKLDDLREGGESDCSNSSFEH